MSETQFITVQIDPTTRMTERYVGSDEDGPLYQSMTLHEAIVERAAQVLTEAIDKAAASEVREVVKTHAEQLVQERLAGIIEDALSGEIVVTNDWGKEVSQGTLRDKIVQHAQSQLTLSSRSGFERNRTVLDKVISDEIDYRLGKDLAEAVAEAKRKLLGKLTEQTSEALSKAILDGVTRSRL